MPSNIDIITSLENTNFAKDVEDGIVRAKFNNWLSGVLNRLKEDDLQSEFIRDDVYENILERPRLTKEQMGTLTLEEVKGVLGEEFEINKLLFFVSIEGEVFIPVYSEDELDILEMPFYSKGGFILSNNSLATDIASPETNIISNTPVADGKPIRKVAKLILNNPILRCFVLKINNKFIPRYTLNEINNVSFYYNNGINKERFPLLMQAIYSTPAASVADTDPVTFNTPTGAFSSKRINGKLVTTAVSFKAAGENKSVKVVLMKTYNRETYHRPYKLDSYVHNSTRFKNMFIINESGITSMTLDYDEIDLLDENLKNKVNSLVTMDELNKFKHRNNIYGIDNLYDLVINSLEPITKININTKRTYFSQLLIYYVSIKTGVDQFTIRRMDTFKDGYGYLIANTSDDAKPDPYKNSDFTNTWVLGEFDKIKDLIFYKEPVKLADIHKYVMFK